MQKGNEAFKVSGKNHVLTCALPHGGCGLNSCLSLDIIFFIRKNDKITR